MAATHLPLRLRHLLTFDGIKTTQKLIRNLTNQPAMLTPITSIAVGTGLGLRLWPSSLPPLPLPLLLVFRHRHLYSCRPCRSSFMSFMSFLSSFACVRSATMPSLPQRKSLERSSVEGLRHRLVHIHCRVILHNTLHQRAVQHRAVLQNQSHAVVFVAQQRALHHRVVPQQEAYAAVPAGGR